MFILFTHTKKNGVTRTAAAEHIEQFLTSDRCAPGFRTLIELVENRVIMLEAVDHVAENYQQQKCCELLMMVEKIYKRNGNKVYTNAMLHHAAEVYEKVKRQQKEEIQVIMKSLESNSQKMKQLELQIKDTAITANDKKKFGKEITALQKENVGLEKRLENINDAQYLVQLTNKILKDEMQEGHHKGRLVDFLGTYTLTTVGGLAGGALGFLGGPRVAALGAGIGAGLGQTAAKTIRDINCNQQ